MRRHAQSQEHVLGLPGNNNNINNNKKPVWIKTLDLNAREVQSSPYGGGIIISQTERGRIRGGGDSEEERPHVGKETHR